jgi:hypothetical protein
MFSCVGGRTYLRLMLYIGSEPIKFSTSTGTMGVVKRSASVDNVNVGAVESKFFEFEASNDFGV